MRWSNWSGRQTTDLDSLTFVRSEGDAAALIAQCNANGTAVRVAGAGHSHSPLVLNDQVIVDVSGLAGVVSVEQEPRQAWVRAGSSIYSLGVQLHQFGLALRNQGDIDRQLLGGVIATGTHGTGKSLQNIPASVCALEIILASGERVLCSAEQEGELFQAARLSVGSVGLVSRVCLQLTSSQVLKEAGYRSTFDAVFDEIPSRISDHERFEFFWYPGLDEAIVKTIDPTDEPPVYPLAEEGSRQAYSYEVLPSHRPVLHTEMEYSVPEEQGPACLKEIRELIKKDFSSVQWPVEYRTVAEDDIWLSMAYGRPTVTISVHQDVRENEESYYRACEEIFLSYGGRPHWGKVNYLTGQQFETCYPNWSDWWRVRDEVDPKGIFLNTYMRSLRN